jgi:hypothetical protein
VTVWTPNSTLFSDGPCGAIRRAELGADGGGQNESQSPADSGHVGEGGARGMTQPLLRKEARSPNAWIAHGADVHVETSLV